jgi:tetratricopeptide (TPR) repeat protein
VNDGAAVDRDGPTPGNHETQRFADALIALGEGKAAVDLVRREVNAARSALPATSPALLRCLSHYAAILESTDALAEADFIRAEALEIVVAAELTTQDAVEAFLGYGMLLCKMHHYDGAIARLREAVRRAEELDGIGSLHRQIILAQAWRSQAQAFEALGEFKQASDALDVLMNIKRHIRFLVFAPTNEG